MSDLNDKLAGLSPAKRRLFEILLREQGLAMGDLPILPRSRASREFPLSPAQQRLWFLDQLEPGSAFYNIPVLVRLRGALDPMLLEQSLQILVARHETLRTIITPHGEEAVQEILPARPIELQVEDLNQLPERERQAEALRIAKIRAGLPFDLQTGPLFHASLFRLEKDHHLALLVMHHIVSDGWSMGIFVSELAQVYAALAQGHQPTLPALGVQYADYACWQRDFLRGETMGSQLEFWRQKLGGELPALELPVVHTEVVPDPDQGATYEFNLPKELRDALTTISRREDATLFMCLLAAFQSLLYRYTGQEEYCVGAPTANRKRPEIEGLIGFFVNTLVLRADLSGEPSFRDLLRRVKEDTLGAYAHQDVPLEMLVKDLQPERNLDRTPLFQVMFALQNTPVRSVALPGLALEPVTLSRGVSTFDLTLSMAENDFGLNGVFEYKTEIFDEQAIQRLAAHFRTLLMGIVADPDCPVTRLPLLTEAERQQVLVEWNATQAGYADDRCIHELIAIRARETPAVAAVAYEDQSLSYAELDRRSNQIAHALQKMGISPDRLVGVLLERSLDLIVAILGILKAGGAYVPLDPTHPPDRLAWMVEDIHQASSGQPGVILTRQDLLPRLPSIGQEEGAFQVLCLDADRVQIEGQPDTAPDSTVQPGHLAYVLYTSGSTGKPKGVCVQHGGAISLLANFQALKPISKGDLCSWWTSINFDVSVYEILSPLVAGGTLVIVPESVRADSRLFIDWLHHHAIQSAYVPPFMLADLLAWLKEHPDRLKLTRLLVGVEPIPEQLLVAINSHLPQLRILNGYGPTEATICCTLYPVPSDSTHRRNAPIGKPTWNTQIYLLDNHMQPVPVGVKGEVYIGGVGLARGYLHRADLTAEQFVPNPFTPVSDRLYKTGDLARYLPDGNLAFIGRSDFQVKIHGFRVELGEIEAIINQHPAVSKSLVLVWEPEQSDAEMGDHQLEKRLVAYVVPHRDQPVTTEILRAYAQEYLPRHMLPAAIMILEDFPVTPNGKVDRKALPKPEWQATAGGGRSTLTPVEAGLVEIWQQVLGVPIAGVDADFFELGGHSLLATQIVARLRSVYGVEVPLRAMFEAPRLKDLAHAVEAGLRNQEQLAPPLEKVPRGEREDLELSYGQQRLWFLHQLEPESAAYNLPVAIRLRGDLNHSAMQHALNEIVKRHEILRTQFINHESRPVQHIADRAELLLQMADLRNLPENARWGEAYRQAVQAAAQPFDLANGPLVRAHLYRLADQEQIALVSMHHIISDGWSTGIFISELAELYRAAAADNRPMLPDLPLQYADYAVWQRRWLREKVLDNQLAYWQSQLAGLPPMLELPTDRPRPALLGTQGGHILFELDSRLSQSLRDLSHQEGATLFMTLLAAFQALLSRYSGQDDIPVGTPVANRQRAEIEGLIGFFVNTLVLRARFDGEPSFRQLLAQVRQVCLEAYVHQDLPFEMLVDALQPQRNLSHTPLFQTMFVMQNLPALAIKLPGITFETLDLDTGVSMFDLTLAVNDEPGGLRAALEYNRDLFDASTIQRMAEHFTNLLAAIVAQPDEPLSRLSLLSTTEQRRLLAEWNATDAPLPAQKSVPQLIAEHAARHPEAVALVVPAQAGKPRQQYTYAELEARASRLATGLVKLGLAPNTLTGLYLDRSLEMAVALLGVLKAGGAYLPLDPDYPGERLAYMLVDSGAPFLLTTTRLKERAERILPPGDAVRLICLDSDDPSLPEEEGALPTRPIDLGDLAYVLYTSGSTGVPKGVMVSHRNLINHNLAVVRRFALNSEDRMLQFAALSFDTSVEEIFPTWLSGGTLVLRPNGALLSGAELAHMIAAERLTVLDLPTAYWHEWVYELELQGVVLPPHLRLLVVGGEKASAERLAAWQKLAPPHVTFMNTYGPTEGTVIDTWFELSGGEPWEATTPIPIGRPLPNVRTYILDGFKQPVPVGVPGDLYLGGLSVAGGYFNQPELTAESFLPDPFSDHPATRLYRTGDRARYRPDGNIEFLGRADQQVKVRGYRVEPEEIERHLNAFAGVRDSTVVARTVSGSHLQLVAYLVPENGEVDLDELRQFLHDRLPDYMLPVMWMTLPALPRLPNGKIDRNSLPEPESVATPPVALGEVPLTAAESTLSEIWAQVLGMAPPGMNDNFFELGGDSILAIQVIARAGQAGLHITPRQFFEFPTIAGLARAAQKAGDVRQIISAEQGPVSGPVPLTPIQHWFFAQEFAQPDYWNQAVLMRVDQPLDENLLNQALGSLLAQHDMLRARFTRAGDGWQQVIQSPEETPAQIVLIEVASSLLEEQRRVVEAHCQRLQASLDLERGPLFQLAYFSFGPAHPGRLFLIAHHLVMDGVSWRILLEDLQSIYHQLLQDGVSRLPPKTTSFQTWSRRLVEFARQESVQAELEYWQAALSHPGLARLPLDFLEGENTGSTAHTIGCTLEQDATRALLRDVQAAYRTEINDPLLAALALTCREWTGRDLLLVELEAHGREPIFEELDISRTVGWFTVAYPQLLDIAGAYQPDEVLKTVKEQLHRVPQGGLGYGLLRYLAGEESAKQLGSLPELEISFNYLGQFEQPAGEGVPLAPADEGRGPDIGPQNNRPRSIEVTAAVYAGRLSVEWTYSSKLHRAITIEKLAQNYMDNLQTIIEHCLSPQAGGHTPSDFELANLSQRQLDKVLGKLGKSKRGGIS